MDSVKRFSNRVENYVKYRPSYPAQLLSVMADEFGFMAESVVADVASGTGKLTELFVTNGNPVFAVEQNGEMRGAAEELFGYYSNFHSIDGTGEATNLAHQCADFITVDKLSIGWIRGKRR